MTHGDDSPPPATLTDAGDCREPDNVFNDPERGVASEEPPRRRFDAFLMTGNMIIHTSSSSDSRPSNRNRQRIPRCAKNASYTSQPVSQSSPVTIDQLLAPDLHPPVSRIPVKKTSRAGQSRLPRPSGQRSNGDSHVTSTCDTNNDLGYTTPVSSKPDREIPTLTSAIPTASSGIPTPTSSVPTPSSQPCSGIPITNPSIPTTPSSIPSTTTSTAIPTISTGIPTPSSVIPTPSSGNPTPSSGIPAPTSGIPTPSSAHKNVTPKPVGAQDFIPSAGNLTTGNLSSGNLSSGNLATGIPSPLRSRRFRRSSDTPAQSKLAASRIPTPSLAHSTTAASTPASSSIKPPSSSIQPHHKDQGDNLTNTNINNNSRSGIVPPQKNQYQHHRGKRSFSFSNGSSVPPVSCPTPPAPPTSANAIPREQHRHDDGSTRLTPSSLPRSTSDPPASVAGDSQPRKYKSKTAFSSAPSESSPPSCLPQHNHSNGIHHSPVNIQNEPCLKPLVIEESIDYNPLTSTHTDRPITPVNPASPIHLPCAPLTTTNAEIQQGDDAKSSPSSMDAIEAPLTDVKLISQNSSVNTEPLDAITVYKLPDEGTSLCSLPAVDQPLPNAKPASSASEVSASPLIQPNTSPISFDPNSSITSDTTPLDINPLVQSSTEFTPITLTTTTASPSPKSPLTHVDSSPLTTSSTAVVIPTTGINMAPDEPLSATYVHTPSLPVEQPKDGVSVELTDDVITTALTTTQTATPTTVPTICPATVPTTIPTTPPTTAPTTAPAQNVEDANSAKDSGSNVICDESTTSSLNPVTSFHSQGHSTSPGHSVLRDHQKRPKSEMLVSCTERPSTLIKPLPDMPSSPLHRAQFTELSSRVPNGYDGESRLLDIPPDDICSEDEAFSRDHRHLASVDTDQLPPPPAALLADYPSAATSPLTTALPSNSKPSTSPNFTSPSTISTCSDMPFVPFTPENDSSYQPPPLLGSDGFYRRHERRLRRAYKPRTASTNTTDDEDDEEDDEESGEMDKFADRLTRLTDRRDSWQTDSDEDNDAANLNSNSPLRHLRLVQLEGDDNRQPVLPPRLNPPPGYGEGSPTPPPPSLSTSATITPHPTMPIQATVSCTRVVDSATPTHSVSTSPSKFNPDQISPSSPKGTSFSRPFEPKLRPTNPPSPLPSRNSAESPSVRTPTPPVLSITQRSVSMTDSSTMTTDLHLNLEPIRLLSKSTEDSNNTLESIKFVDSTSEEEQVAVDSQVDSQVSCSEVKENSEPEKEDQTELSVDDKQCDTEIIETPIDNG